MKSIEAKIIQEWNSRFPEDNLMLSEFEYEKFDAHNQALVTEVKYRNTWYDKLMIEFDKYSYNSWYAHITNKKFIYVVAHAKRIVIFNITDLNKSKYNFHWEYKTMPKHTEFGNGDRIVKFVGYLDLNILSSSDSVYEFETDTNLSDI